MKRLLCVVLMVAAGMANADQLSDANQLLAAKAYDKAFPIYSKLAAEGNAEAQFRLGEMYWFGDGTAVDLAKARTWFEKSAAAGNADARESLDILKRREVRGGEITYWTTTYAGQDMVSGKYDCKRPAIPAVSTSNAQIKATEQAVAEWEACYNGFAANLNDALPAGKRIPADVLDMMSPREIDVARQHLDAVYGKIAADAQARAATIIAERDAWRRETEKFAVAENARINAEKLQLEIEQRKSRQSNEALQRAPTGPKGTGR